MTHAVGPTLAQLGLHLKFGLGCNRSNVYVRFSHSNARSTCLNKCQSWWRHQMKSFPRKALYEWNPPIQRPVTRSFGVFFDVRLNKRLSKRSRCRWFETLWRSLWRDVNVMLIESYAKQMKNKRTGPISKSALFQCFFSKKTGWRM